MKQPRRSVGGQRRTCYDPTTLRQLVPAHNTSDVYRPWISSAASSVRRAAERHKRTIDVLYAVPGIHYQYFDTGNHARVCTLCNSPPPSKATSRTQPPLTDQLKAYWYLRSNATTSNSTHRLTEDLSGGQRCLGRTGHLTPATPSGRRGP